MRPARSTLPLGFLVLSGSLGFVACRASIDAFGSNPVYARHAADHFLAGFAYRFYAVRRDSNFHRARELMGQYALVPSRLYRDSSLWNLFPADSSRALIVGAAFVNGNYTFAANAQAPAPLALGAQRHVLSLKWLGGGNYEWATHVDHAIGPVAPAHVGTAIVATLAAAEGRSSAEALADARGTFPETGKHLAQLFSIDSLRTSHAGGATRTTFSASFRPERLRGRYPFFAAFVSKYVMPAVYRLQVSDHNGRPYIDMTGRNGQLVVRLRSRNHTLVSLAGVPAEMPDSLRLLADLSMKYRVFRVGFTKLSGDLVIERSEHQRAWTMRFQREPAWHFPLAVDKLIRNPLRRPFQGRGAELSLGVRNEGSPQTSSYRSARFVVNESAIMRWLGRLGATAFGDFSGRTELEENLFLYETFEALGKDISKM